MDYISYRFTVPLETHYDKPNRNGVVYSKEAITKMIESEYFKELERNKCIFITPGFPRDCTIDPISVVGRVNSLDIENGTADISTNKYVYLLYDNGCDMTLGMNYTGKINNNKKVTNMKFISFSLIDRNTGKFIL